MKIHFLGTLSGLWPIENRRHESMIIEINDTYYLFDAGERCSKTAYLMGLDLEKIKKIVISHPHMDHIGGLGMMLYDIKMQSIWQNKPPKYSDIDLYICEDNPWLAYDKILNFSKKWDGGLRVNYHKITDGVVFEDENIRVTAFHNYHLGEPKDGKWRTYSFIIEAEGKKVVYTADIKTYEEMDSLIGDGCDALIGETGHHNYVEVCDYLRGKNIKNLFFTHHGRSIIFEGFSTPGFIAQKHFDGNVMICEDATTVTL